MTLVASPQSSEDGLEPLTGRTLFASLARYAEADHRRSVWQLVSSVVGFALFWAAAYASLRFPYPVTVLVAMPAAILIVRLFIIQHDCGHGSFFRSRRANDVVGALLGVVTLTPYAYWRRMHAIHHANSGNLDRRGLGDIETLTVREYLALDRGGRLRYRVFRNPLVVLVVGPVYHFFLHQRLPYNLPLTFRREWASVLTTNVAIALFVYTAVATVGLGAFLRVHLPITWIGGSLGVWLFYVQHQFEHAYWVRDEDWAFESASTIGSSHLDLPAPLHWCTGNIGFHHVHHLCPRIPNYRLQASSEAHPDIPATRLSLLDGMRCLRFKLWDEETRRLVGFGAVRPRSSA